MSATAQRKRRGRKRGIHPLIATFLVIAATVFVTYYAFNGGLPFVSHYTIYALTSNSVNVRSESPVRIAGIDVGVVQGTSPGPGNTTRIEFTMQSNGLPVHTDATITIRDRLFLEGSYYLALDPGSPSAPIVHSGFTIPESNVSSPVQFYKLLSTFDVATRQSFDNILNSFDQGFSPSKGQPESNSGAGGLKAAVPEFTPVFKDTAYISQALTGTHAGDVERLLSTGSDVTTTLAQSSARLEDLVSGLNSASSSLASADGAVAQSVSGLDQTLRIAPASLAAVDRALPPLARLGTALAPSLKLAPPILDGVTSAVRELAAIVMPVERDRLLTSVKATFEQFPAVLTELGQAFPIAKQVTDCLSTHVTPILSSIVPDGSLSSGRAVWQDFVHFLPGVAGATANFDGNGPYTRTLIGAGSNSLSLGTLPLLGQLVGSEAPGGGAIQGARPTWVGALKPSDFRPDVKCATQPVPSLAAPTAAPDAHSLRSGPAPASARTDVRRMVARIDRVAGP